MALSNEELLWLGKDNSIDLLLYADDEPQDLSAVTEMRLAFGGTTVVLVSTHSTAGMIKWGESTYDTGEIRIIAGGSSLISTSMVRRKFKTSLIVYDASNSSGIVWDNDIPIRVMADPLT